MTEMPILRRPLRWKAATFNDAIANVGVDLAESKLPGNANGLDNIFAATAIGNTSVIVNVVVDPGSINFAATTPGHRNVIASIGVDFAESSFAATTFGNKNVIASVSVGFAESNLLGSAIGLDVICAATTIGNKASSQVSLSIEL